MALNISGIGDINTTFIFAILSGIVILLFAILYVIDYQLKKKKAMQESSPEYKYSLRFDEIKRTKAEPAQIIDSADKLARDFMEEKFEIDPKMDYSQLAESFREKGKPYIVSFCQTMLELLYSGEKPSNVEARSIMNSVEMMLRQEGYLISIKHNEKVKDENFIDSLARYISKWISSREKYEETNPEENIEKSTVQNSNEVSDDKNKQDVQSTSIRNSDSPGIIKKREIVVERKGKKSANKEREEYKYIESLDSLDRIKHRIKKHIESRDSEKKI